MDTTQIYQLVNEINEQSTGKVAITAVDTASFVALGDAIVSSTVNTEGFLNTLMTRIYDDIVEGRAYKSRYRTLIKTRTQFGAILRKISIDMPTVTEEKAIPLTDGQTVDQWEVRLPKTHQYLFTNRTPYSTFVTIQRQWLKEAFLSEEAMSRFIAGVFMKCSNALELSVENLAKLSMANYAGIAAGTSQEIQLVTMYNAETGKTLAAGQEALHDPDFLRYAVGVMKETMVALNDMSVLYNNAAEERFTPYDKQKVRLLSRFVSALETVSYYSAFNENYIKLVDFDRVVKWQGTGTAPLQFTSDSSIHVTVRKPAASTTTEVNLTNVVGMIFDDEALGATRFMDDVQTTPLNARGLYYNTFWHEQQTWFNAMDENFVLFTLN